MLEYFGIAGLFVLVLRHFSPRIYDFVIVSMTKRWYEAVLLDIPENSKVLDVGIGTATSLLENSEIIKQKKLKIVGLDYDNVYIAAAKKAIENHPLHDDINVFCRDIYDDSIRKDFNGFDMVYFSGSWSLMPDPVKAAQICANLLNPGGKIYITQTFQKKAGWSSWFLKVFKPLMRYFTTIDFGRLTFVYEMENYLKQLENGDEEMKLTVEECKVLEAAKNNSFIASYFIKLSVK
eukprot:snap_masked-scaffold_6-processed-gene-0.30-mRNA-1 protein AED:0.01 eAED:0.01 QI:0/-1/0/1/-1/1/1/0/234